MENKLMFPPKTIYVRGCPVRVKYASVSNLGALRHIQSIILGEVEESQLFANSAGSSDNGDSTAESLG